MQNWKGDERFTYIGEKCPKRDFDELQVDVIVCLICFRPVELTWLLFCLGVAFSKSDGVGAAVVWLFPCKKTVFAVQFLGAKVMWFQASLLRTSINPIWERKLWLHSVKGKIVFFFFLFSVTSFNVSPRTSLCCSWRASSAGSSSDIETNYSSLDNNGDVFLALLLLPSIDYLQFAFSVYSKPVERRKPRLRQWKNEVRVMRSVAVWCFYMIGLPLCLILSYQNQIFVVKKMLGQVEFVFQLL